MSESVGAVLTRLREERGLSKSRLAREAGISDAYVVQIEQGQRSPSERVLRDLARVLRVAPHHLLIPAGVYSVETLARAEAKSMEELDAYGRQRADVSPASWDRVFHSNLSSVEAEEAYMRGEYDEEAVPDADYWLTEGSAWAPEGWSRLSPADQRLFQQLINRVVSIPLEEADDGDSPEA